MEGDAGLLTLDVEDWDHANYPQLESQAPRIRSLVRRAMYRMDANIDRWIEITSRHGARSTCFVLGEFVQRYPHTLRKLRQAGHEIASHGYEHRLVHQMSREEFREYLRRSVGLLGEVLGEAPKGFRAPSWSAGVPGDGRTPWFAEELLRAGFVYDSSVFPARIPLIGSGSAAPVAPFLEQGLLRVPASVMRLGPLRVPYASGAFFRMAPGWLIRMGVRRALRRRAFPMIVLHPRELDPAHPRLPLQGWEARVHYAGLSSTVPKLESLLARHRWVTIEESLPRLRAGGEAA